MTARTKQYRSDACEAIHETARALHEVGAIDGQAMREFDEACLIEMTALPKANPHGFVPEVQNHGGGKRSAAVFEGGGAFYSTITGPEGGSSP